MSLSPLWFIRLATAIAWLWAGGAFAADAWKVVAPSATDLGYQYAYGDDLCGARTSEITGYGASMDSCSQTACAAEEHSRYQGKQSIYYWQRQTQACLNPNTTSEPTPTSQSASGVIGQVELILPELVATEFAEAWVAGMVMVITCYLMSYGIGTILSTMNTGKDRIDK